MTDAAIDAGGAPAPAEGVAIEPVATPQPGLPLEAPQRDAPKPEPDAEKPKPLKDTIRAADAKVRAERQAKDEAAKPEAKATEAEKPPVKAEDKPTPVKGPDGKFVSQKPGEGQEGQNKANAPVEAEPPKPTAFKDAPQRFDDTAKSEWEKVPESVRGAVHRTITENERGIQKYKADAERWSELKEYHELAEKTGTTVKDSLNKFVTFERMLRTPNQAIPALERLVAHAGLRTPDGRSVTLRDIAGHILGQKPEHVAAKTESALQAAMQKIESLERQIGGVTQSIEQQRASQTEAQVVAFANDHPRFEELAADIEFFLTSRRASDLTEAYELAERLNPAPVQPQTPAPLTPAPEARPQTPATPAPLKPEGQKSIHGSPGGGSDPQRQKGPVPSIRESLKRAAARVG